MKLFKKLNFKKIALAFIFLFLIFFVCGCNENDEPDDVPSNGENANLEIEIGFEKNEIKIKESTQLKLNLKNVELNQLDISISDPSVIKIVNGTIVPLKVGKAIITASFDDVTSSMTVIVIPTIQKEFYVGEEIDIDSALDYSIEDGSILKIVDGKIQALKAGQTKLTISLKTDASVTTTETITVENMGPMVSYEKSTIPLNSEVFVGLKNGNNKDYKWELNDDSLGFLFDDYYLAVYKLGTIVITITNIKDPSEIYTYTFEIIPELPRVSVSQEKILVNDTVDLIINGSTLTSDYNIISDNPEIVKIENGRLIALAEGTAEIKVENKLYPDSYKTISILVYPVEPVIEIVKNQINVGGSIKINIPNYKDGYAIEVDDESIVKCENNLLTGLKEGLTVVTVYLTSNREIFSQVDIEVVPVSPEVSLAYPIITVGSETGFVITNFEELKYKEYSDYVVSSNDTSVASIVNQNGVYTIKGIKKGTCDITIIGKENQNIQTNVTIEVINQNDDVLYASLEGISSVIKTGDIIPIKVKNSTSLANYQIVTSDISKATISEKGKLVTCEAGIIKVTVVLKSDKNVKFTMTVSIEGVPNINYIDRIIDVAEDEIGYVEGANNDTKYGDWYGMPNAAWCARFVSWCANQAGISTNIIPKYASCALGKEWFESRGQFKYKGSYTPKAGDVIFFLSDGASHTGLVIACEGGTVYTIEGNTANKVAKRYYSLNKSTITGYGVPNYPKYDGTVNGGGTGGATDGSGESTT